MAKRTSPITEVTKKVRAMVTKTMPGAQAFVSTKTLAATSVSYPAGADHEALAALAREAGAKSIVGGEYGMTINWM